MMVGQVLRTPVAQPASFARRTGSSLTLLVRAAVNPPARRRLACCSACLLTEPSPVVHAPEPQLEQLSPSQQLHTLDLPEFTPEEADREAIRRARISSANAGRRPWNKGRKHSEETIAKIRERTREAMQREEVVQAYKEGVQKALQERGNKPSQETKEKIAASVARVARMRKEQQVDQDRLQESPAAAAPPPEPTEEQPVKPKRVRKRPTQASAQPPPPASDVEPPAEPPTQPATQPAPALHTLVPSSETPAQPQQEPSKRRSRSTQPASISPATPDAIATETPPVKVPKPRGRTSPEHRAAIAAAIKAKWQDPGYRSRAVAGIHAHVEGLTGQPAGSSISSNRRRRKASDQPSTGRSSTSSSTAGSPSKGGSKSSPEAATLQRWQDIVSQVKAIVTQVLATERLIAKIQISLEGTRVRAQALINDPLTAERARALVSDAEDMLSTAQHKLQQLQQQVPPGITYDHQGNVHVVDPAAFLNAKGPFSSGSLSSAVSQSTSSADSHVTSAGNASSSSPEQPRPQHRDSVAQTTSMVPLTSSSQQHTQQPALSSGTSSMGMSPVTAHCGHGEVRMQLTAAQVQLLNSPARAARSTALSGTHTALRTTEESGDLILSTRGRTTRGSRAR